MIGTTVNISPGLPSTCAQNSILSLLIIHIIPSCQIYVAIDNPFFDASSSCATTCSNFLNDVRAVDNMSHDDRFQRSGGQCISHLYKIRNEIQVTLVLGYCGERQG